MKYSEEQISSLRKTISDSRDLSDRRKAHILAVERMAARLGELFAPDKTDLLRVAALLHDVTKEYPTEKQLELCSLYGHTVTDAERCAPKTLHAITAALIIPDRFPDYADPTVISAVRWHTTGCEDMTLCDELIYLADYIDDTRSFDDCVTLRNAFFDAHPERMSADERLEHLDGILITSYNMTVKSLLADGSPISPDTVLSMNRLICRKILKEKTKK